VPHTAELNANFREAIARLVEGKSAVFAGNSVMLKEHFRCVPAIIEFSNREFYPRRHQAVEASSCERASRSAAD
jgi:superfamily I DNA and/or RNA helicase